MSDHNEEGRRKRICSWIKILEYGSIISMYINMKGLECFMAFSMKAMQHLESTGL